MPLFFDQDWFNDRLNALGLHRDALATCSGMTPDELDMVFDDRRELSVSEIHAFADLLSVSPHIIAKHCGVADLDFETTREQSQMVGGAAPSSEANIVLSREALAGLHERIDRLESLLEMVLTGLEVRR